MNSIMTVEQVRKMNSDFLSKFFDQIQELGWKVCPVLSMIGPQTCNSSRRKNLKNIAKIWPFYRQTQFLSTSKMSRLILRRVTWLACCVFWPASGCLRTWKLVETHFFTICFMFLYYFHQKRRNEKISYETSTAKTNLAWFIGHIFINPIM